MNSYHQDNLERIEDVSVLLKLAQDLLLRLSSPELDDAKASLRRTMRDVSIAEQQLVNKWGGSAGPSE